MLTSSDVTEHAVWSLLWTETRPLLSSVNKTGMSQSIHVSRN